MPVTAVKFLLDRISSMWFDVISAYCIRLMTHSDFVYY